MTKNVGKDDKTIRIIIGTVILATGLFVQMSLGWRIAAFAVAVIAYVTAFWGF